MEAGSTARPSSTGRQGDGGRRRPPARSPSRSSPAPRPCARSAARRPPWASRRRRRSGCSPILRPPPSTWATCPWAPRSRCAASSIVARTRRPGVHHQEPQGASAAGRGARADAVRRPHAAAGGLPAWRRPNAGGAARARAAPPAFCHPGGGRAPGECEARVVSVECSSMGADHDAYFDEVEARFENAHDLDLGLEEEFQVLDRETLALTGAFEVLRDSAPPRLRERIAGELLTSEIEVSTPRTLHFGQAAKQLLLNRAELFAHADAQGYALGATGTHPFSGWKDQQIIDTPHYRLVEDRLKYVAWRNNTWAAHVHVGVRGCDRAVAVCDALRTYLPHLLALSANSPFIEDVWTRLHSVRTQTFVRMFPRCGIPDVFGTWAAHRQLLRGARRHQLHPGVHADLVVGAPASSLRHGRGPHLRRADRGVGEPGHLVADGRADRAPVAHLRRGPAAADPRDAVRRGEPLAGDPLRARRQAGGLGDGRGTAGCRRRAPSGGAGGALRRRHRPQPAPGRRGAHAARRQRRPAAVSSSRRG